jgi:hypothetical protein
MDRRYDPPSDPRDDDDDVIVSDDPRTSSSARSTDPMPPPPVEAEAEGSDRVMVRDRTDRAEVEDRDRADHVVVEDRDPAEGIREARERFGGLDIPAVLCGMLVGLAMLLILSGLASAAFGEIAFQTGVSGNEVELSVGALITAGVVLFLSFLTGGWAAGRMARYTGALNGFMVALTFVIFLGILALLGVVAGDAYNLFDNLRVAEANLPNWFSEDTLTTGAIVSAIAFAAVTFLGAILGGLWGGRLHRRADKVIASRAADDPRVVRVDDDARR